MKHIICFIISVVALFGLCTPSVEAAAAVVTAGSETRTTGAASLDSGTVTVSSGDTNRGLCSFLDTESLVTAVSAVYDNGGTNQSLTQIGSTLPISGSEDVFVFCVLGPSAATAKAVHWAWTGSANAKSVAIYFSGVDPGALATSFIQTTNTGTGTNPAVTITSAVGNVTVAVATDASGAPSISVTDQTSWFVDNTASHGFAGSYAAGAASTTHNFGLTGSANWGAVGLNVVAASGGGSTGSTLLIRDRE